MESMVAEFKIDWARAIEDAAIEYADAYTELQCDADNDHQREHLKALKDLRETIKRGLEVAAAQPERKPIPREHRKALIESAINARDDDGLITDMEREAWLIDAVERFHGIKDAP